ncbi:MAG: type II secretion system protein GspG [Candidatus Brocadiales bacterium]|nr:type II secretion system protein GspG [Candidatus Bathyanammoxibius sp.]
MTKGFTATESLVIIAIVFIVALVLTPLLVKRSAEKKIRGAEMETERIAKAILDFYRDTGYYPIRRQGNNDSPVAVFKVLTSKGTMPYGGRGWWLKQPRDTLENHLNLNRPGYPAEGKSAWRGPYLEPHAEEDPWGHCYVFNAAAVRPGSQSVGMVISAGPNGVINTEFFQSGAVIWLRKDDIGSRVR